MPCIRRKVTYAAAPTKGICLISILSYTNIVYLLNSIKLPIGALSNPRIISRSSFLNGEFSTVDRANKLFLKYSVDNNIVTVYLVEPIN